MPDPRRVLVYLWRIRVAIDIDLELVASPQQRRFGRDKRDTLTLQAEIIAST